MDDVLLGPPHGTAPAAVKANKNFKSSEHINEKWDGPYHGFGYISLVSDSLALATWSQRELLFYTFRQVGRYEDKYYSNGTIYYTSNLVRKCI